MKKLIYTISGAGASLLPMLVFAQQDSFANLRSTAATLINWINTIFIPFLLALAVFMFLFGIFKYIISAADEEKRKEARGFIFWSLIFIAVFLSVWGLISFVTNTFGLNQDDAASVGPTPVVSLPPR